MNLALLSHEWLALALGLAVLLADLWLPASARRGLGYIAALGVTGILLYSLFAVSAPADGSAQFAFGHMYVMDGLALFFKRFFLLAAALVLLISIEFSDRFESGLSEFYALVLFALTGMLFASSTNDLSLMFVSLELITVTFYVLTSFQRSKVASLESGVKYLILGALSTAFTVFGIALVYGMSGSLNFNELAIAAPALGGNKIFLFGLLFILAGLGFKIAMVPFQVWAPDVYQGAPAPTTAFLAVGSKAAGFVLLLRVLFLAIPAISVHWVSLLIVLSGITILYGNLCAIPQRGIKRILAYSGISHAGYLLMGVAAIGASGQSAVLYYLTGYLFTVLAAFTVICAVMRHAETDDISSLSGLHHRSPFLAVVMTLAMVSLAGVPPLAGFFGKFLLIKAAVEQAPINPGFYCLVATALVGVVISFYYYFGIVRVIYSDRSNEANMAPIRLTLPVGIATVVCVAGMLILGLYPAPVLNAAVEAVKSLSH